MFQAPVVLLDELNRRAPTRDVPAEYVHHHDTIKLQESELPDCAMPNLGEVSAHNKLLASEDGELTDIIIRFIHSGCIMIVFS